MSGVAKSERKRKRLEASKEEHQPQELQDEGEQHEQQQRALQGKALRLLAQRQQVPVYAARSQLLQHLQQSPTLIVVGETGRCATERTMLLLLLLLLLFAVVVSLE